MKYHHNFALCLFISIFVGLGHVYGTVGSAEWELPTPGGHVICASDPFKETNGCCLRSADPIHGVIDVDEVQIFASQINQWQFYNGHIAGQAKGGYFLFDESQHRISYFKSKLAMKTEIKVRQLGRPTSPAYSPNHGWLFTWGWPMISQNTIAAPLQTVVKEMTERDRTRLAQSYGVPADQLVGRTLIEFVRKYRPALMGNSDEVAKIMAGQHDDQATLSAIVKLAHQIKQRGRSTPPLISLLIQQARDETKNQNSSDDPTRTLNRSIKLYLTRRVLQEYLSPSESNEALGWTATTQEAVFSARTKSLEVLLNAIRSQLELAKLQHQGEYPDLVQYGWRPLTQPTGPGANYPFGSKYGPYLSEKPRNPWSPQGVDSTSIAADTSAAWQYNTATGELKGIVAMTDRQFARFNLNPRDCARVDGTPSPEQPQPRQYYASQAKAAALHSLLQMIRSQLELAQFQHQGRYPDLTTQSWAPLLKRTDRSADYRPGQSCGPYLQRKPRNPFATDGLDPTSIAADSSAAWQFHAVSGELRAVVAMPEELYLSLRFHPRDIVRRDP